MMKQRVIETENGLQGKTNAESYDRMMRKSRDNNILYTDKIIKAGIASGPALEIGPGPGYLGLEWLKKTANTTLKGVDISADMVKIAEKNAAEYGFLTTRARYFKGNAVRLPFSDRSFSAVFTNAALHEWEDPVAVCNEIHRVLKPGGRYFISDLRRDMNFLVKTFLKLSTQPKEMRAGVDAPINASYTKDEVRLLLLKTKLNGYTITANPFSIIISGIKQ